MRINNEIRGIHQVNKEQTDEISSLSKKENIKTEDTTIFDNSLRIPKSIIDELPPELKEIVIKYYQEGYSLDKEALQAIKSFLNKFPADLEDKLEAVKALMSKGLEINIANLDSIYQALFGKDFSESLLDIIDNQKFLQELSNLKSAETNGAMPNIFHLDNLVMEIEDMKISSVSLDKISAFIKAAIEEMSMEPKEKTSLIKATNELIQAANYRMEDIANRILNKILNELSNLAKIEKNTFSNEASHMTITKLSKKENGENIELNNLEEYIISSLSTLTISGKDYIVTEISKRLKEARGDFKELKLDISRNLDMLTRHINKESKVDIHNAHIVLEKTIDKLDKAILKGDITLFTDMKMEKELIKSSSDLVKAKAFLQKGEYEKAYQLADKVKNIFEKINWRPSQSRIIHMAKLRENIDNSPNDKERLDGAVKNFLSTINQNKGSGRMLYEALRLLGMDHEGESARFLALQDLSNDNISTNLKASLLRMMENNPGQNNEALSQLAHKITGQQLLSNSDKGQFQTMFLNIPLLIDGRIQDAKLYINSRKEKEKLDFENCSIYFLIETKKLGETGILLTSTGRNIAINIKNNKETLEKNIKSLLDNFRENLIDLGYEIGNISFSKFEDRENIGEKMKSKQAMNNKRNLPRKGFDIKV